MVPINVIQHLFSPNGSHVKNFKKTKEKKNLHSSYNQRIGSKPPVMEGISRP